MDRARIVGRFVAVMGEPKLYTGGSDEGTLPTLGMDIVLGSRIETGDADKAELRFNDGTTLRLDFNTSIQIPTEPSRTHGLMAAGTRPIPRPESVSLEAGRLYASVTHLPDERHFRVETAAATAEVLGTSFELGLDRSNADAKLKATLKVTEGKVAFYNALGRVEAGKRMQTEALQGSRPTEPKRILSHRSFSFGYYFWVEIGAELPTPTELAAKLVYPLGTIGAEIRRSPEGDLWIVNVDRGTPAWNAGLRSGSLLLALDGNPKLDAENVRGRIADGAGSHIKMSVLAANRRVEANVPVVRAANVEPQAMRAPLDLAEATRPMLYGNACAAKARLSRIGNLMTRADALNNLGVVYEALDEPAKAARSYKRAVELQPLVVLYRLNLATALKSIGNLPRAEEELREAIRLAPSRLRAKIELADVLSLAGRHDEASKVILPLSSSSPLEEARLRHWDATVLVRAGRLPQAEIPARRSVELNPERSDFRSLLSMIVTGQLRYKEGAEHARIGIRLDPTNAWAVYMLGWCDTGVADQPVGLESYLRAAQLAPRDPELRGAALAVAFWNYRSDEATFQVVDQLFKEGVAGIAAHQSRVQLLGRQGRLEEADRWFERAQNLWPDDPWMMLMRSDVYWFNGKRSESLQQLEHLIDLYPNIPTVRQIYGDRLTAMGRKVEAEAQYRKVIELDPNTAVPYNSLGKLALASGRIAEAESCYRKLKEMAPEMGNYPNDASMTIDLANYLVLKAKGEAQVNEFRAKVEAGGSSQGLEHDTAWLARSLRDIGRPDESERECRKYLAKQSSPWIRNELIASICVQRGGTDEAYELARQNVEEHPENGHIQGRWIDVLVRRGEISEASSEHLRLAKLWNPSTPQASPLHEILVNAGRADEAIRLLESRMRTQRRAEDAVALARLQFDHGSAAEGVRITRESFRAWPSEPAVLGLVMDYMVGGGSLQDALTAAKTLVAIRPDDPHAWVRLGDILNYTRSHDRSGASKAEAAYRRSLAIRPNASAWFALGNFYASRRMMDDAREAYRKALAVDPNHDGARGALFWLEDPDSKSRR